MMKLSNLFSKDNIFRYSKKEDTNHVFCELCKSVLFNPVKFVHRNHVVIKDICNKDIAKHERICKKALVKCNLCGKENCLREDLEKHIAEECKNSIKCTECKSFVQKDQKSKIIDHSCVEHLKIKVDSLQEVQEIQEIEFKEHLRIRDKKIKSLIFQQRQFWKYLTKLERKVYGSQGNLRMPSPMPDCSSVTIKKYFHNENAQEINDEKEESEGDFYTFYENEILDENFQNSEMTESVTDKDSNRSTQKSDTEGKLTEMNLINLNTNNKNKLDENEKENKDEVRINDDSEIDSEEKDSQTELQTTTTKEKELFSNLEAIQPTQYHVDHDLIKLKTKMLAELKDLSNWKKSTKKNGVEIFTYNGKEEGNYTGLMGIMELPFNHNDIFEALCIPEIPFNANPFADRMEVLERINDDTMVIYMKFKGMMLVNGRDFILQATRVSIQDANSIDGVSQALMTFSVDHPNSPEVPKSTVRGDMLVSGWICSKIDEERTMVVNMAVNDLKGIIPKFVINAGASTHTNLLVNFKKKLEELKDQGLLHSQTIRGKESRFEEEKSCSE